MTLIPLYKILALFATSLLLLSFVGLWSNYYEGIVGGFYRAHRTIGNHFAQPAHIYYAIILFSIWMLGILVYMSKEYETTRAFPAFRSKYLYSAIVLISGLFMWYHYGSVRFPDFIFEEDGIFENLTVLALFGTSGALFLAGRSNGNPMSSGISFTLMVMAGVIFLGAMEEISWGQRIFGWDTPEIVKEYNYKDETNVHNLFIGYNQLIRLMIALFMASLLLLSDKKKIPWIGREFQILLPSNKYFYLPFFLIFSHVSDELFEVISSLLFLSYSIDILKFCRTSHTRF